MSLTGQTLVVTPIVHQILTNRLELRQFLEAINLTSLDLN